MLDSFIKILKFLPPELAHSTTINALKYFRFNFDNIDDPIFGTGKFYKEKQDDKKEDIYSNIDEMLSGTLDSEENK